MTLDLYTYNAKITNVVDGDTVDASIDVGFSLTTLHRLRLVGVDTCEMNDKDPVKRASAIAAKEYMIQTVLGKNVVLTTYKSDAFGRYLAAIYLGDVCVNDELVRLGFAK